MAELSSPICWLCARPLGVRVEWHHPVPKSRGGRDRQPIHPICHRTIHIRFSNAELEKIGGELSALRADGEITRFLGWIEGKDPDFHAPTRRRK